MIRPAKYNITAYQGATYNEIFVAAIDGTPINYTGYTGKMQIRKYQNKDSALIHSATTANSGLLLNSTGMVQPFISAATMDTLPAGNWFYDIELTDASGVVTRFLMGNFNISPQVSA